MTTEEEITQEELKMLLNQRYSIGNTIIPILQKSLSEINSNKEFIFKCRTALTPLYQNIENQNKTQELNKAIFDEVKCLFNKYIITTEENIELLSLWTLGTYFHNQFETFPILQLIAQKRSGKTRTLKLLSSLCSGSDGSVSTSPTETSLFRHKQGALFFDEMESISSKERGAFRETLNAVYKRGNKIVRYKEGKNKEYVEEYFFPYYPIGLANISGFGDVLSDRAIQLILKRSNNSVTKLIEDFSSNKEISNLKNKLNSLKTTIPINLAENWNLYIEKKELEDDSLQEMFQKIYNSDINGRSLEIFFPLLIISYYCDDLDNFLKNSKIYVEKREQEDALDDIDESLKLFIYKKSLEYSGYVKISDILFDFRKHIDSPEDWVNSKWLGRALKRLDLVQHKRLINGKAEIIIKFNSEKVGLVELVGLVGEKKHYIDNDNATKNKNNNTTNTTNTINTTNTTNTTKIEESKEEFDFLNLKESKNE